MNDMSKIRYEAFGGLIRTEKPPATIFVDKQYMKNLGYTQKYIDWYLQLIAIAGAEE